MSNSLAMKLLAHLVSLILLLLGALHVYWGLGGIWPASSEQSLINMVIGFPGMTEMPSANSTFVVAFLIFLCALIAQSSLISLTPLISWVSRLARFGVGLVFFARGLGGYFFEQFAWDPVEPFATYNRLFYSPLCLAIATGFFLLLIRQNKRKRVSSHDE